MLALVQKSERQLWLGRNNPDNRAICSIAMRIPGTPYQLGLLQIGYYVPTIIAKRK